MSTTIAWIGGNIERSEFQIPFHAIANLLDKYNHVYKIINDAPVASDPNLRLVCLFQAYPEQFSLSKLNDLRKISPLVPIILLCGTNTEGSQRTSKPLKGVFQFYAHQFDARIFYELEQFISGNSSVFDLPATSESEDVFLWTAAASAPENLTADTTICHILRYYGPFGNDPAMNRFWTDRCRQENIAVWPANKKIDKSFSGTILADADDSKNQRITEAIQRLRMNYADAKINVYINSPRIYEKMTFINAGADRILPKLPFC